MSGEGFVWRVRHHAVTGSTNRDALDGAPGDVFTADMQTDGRGRLDHRWLSPPGENLMMSAVVGVAGQSADEVATLPLVVGLAVAEAVDGVLAANGASSGCAVQVKWPNDVLVEGRKACGILCERKDDRVIIGIGLNVNQTAFDPSIAERAISMRLALPQSAQVCLDVGAVRDKVLAKLADAIAQWRKDGFRALWPQVSARDFLKGRMVVVRRTDDDAEPAAGLCGGVRADGALDVGGQAVFAGEAHVGAATRSG